MFSHEKPNLTSVIVPDQSRLIDFLYQSAAIYLNDVEGITFQTFAREVLTFSLDHTTVYYNPPMDKYPLLDWPRLYQHVERWSMMIRTMIPELKFIELMFHLDLITGLEFMVLHYEPNHYVESRWS
jgi:hypothetical protein